MLFALFGLQATGAGLLTWYAKREARRARSKALLAGQYKAVTTPFLDRWVKHNFAPRTVTKAQRWQAQKLVSVARWCVHRKFFEDLILGAIAGNQKLNAHQSKLNGMLRMVGR